MGGEIRLCKVKKDDKWYSDVSIEDHYVLIAEPGDEYLTHVTVPSGKSSDIANSILAVINEHRLNDSICVIGCDSTNTNTGIKGGVIRHLELSLGRPLQWFICMLHTNELPLRHLFVHLDGVTSGANSFSGPIGKALGTCESKPIVSFIPIVSSKPMLILNDDILDDLSVDQKYLYNIMNAIRSGVVDDDLARRKPGPLNHSRWVTLANRVCRLYVSTSSPDDNLFTITHFIVTNYGPNWFAIKGSPRCTDGPKHVYTATQLLQELPDYVVAIVKPYVSRNAYFAHHENVLLCMLADDDKDKRTQAVHLILQCRAQKNKELTIRQFQVPKLRYEASDWSDMIDLSNISEPPITQKMTEEEIKSFEKSPLSLLYPNHTQSVERGVKIVTEASGVVYGFESRDGFIRARIASRCLMPKFDTKVQFSCNFPEQDVEVSKESCS